MQRCAHYRNIIIWILRGHNIFFLFSDSNGDRNGAPVFTKPLKDMNAHDGDRVTLECEVTGTPRPQISWFKGNKEVLDCQVLTLL